MTLSIYIVAYIAISASAGIGGVALSRTGRLSDHLIVAVTGCCNLFFIAVSASAGIDGLTILCTGSIHNSFIVAMTGCGKCLLVHKDSITNTTVLAVG